MGAMLIAGVMSLDELSSEIEDEYASLPDELTVSLDRQTKNELAFLRTVLGTEEPDELLRRAIHLLFQSTVDVGGMDFHLRRSFDITYDEYLSGMTYDEMRGGNNYQPPTEDDRRYQF